MADAAYEIVSRVYFGSAATTRNATIMSHMTHVINCDSGAESTGPLPQSTHFLFLQSFDEETYPILDTHFDPLCAYIDAALADPNAHVYIHCYMGMNRSAALAVAYACRATGLPAAAVIATTRMGLRRLILTNQGFERQLIDRFP